MKRKIEEIEEINYNKDKNDNQDDNHDDNQDKDKNQKIEMSLKKQKIHDNCPICLNQMQDTNTVTTSCNHRFCFQCLMDSCKVKNNCPLCRKEIEQYNQKRLPIFKHINMFNNILASINNPSYNVYYFIDELRDVIFEQITDFDENLTDYEFNIKNNILNKIEHSQRLKNNIDICVYDLIHEFINKVIVDNTTRMCNWYHSNF